MDNIITIAVLGGVNSGKSSFINSFVGFPITNISLYKETFRIYGFHCNNETSLFNINTYLKKYDIINKLNKRLRNSNEIINGNDIGWVNDL